MKTKISKTIGSLLVDSLTSDQLICFLDSALHGINLEQLMHALKKVDLDIATSVQNIVERISRQPVKSSKEIRTVSDQKILESWNSLWRHWDDIVAEVGVEDGNYVVQEAHWEPPYFDSYQFAQDLEPIAHDLLGLINDAHNLVNEPELFFDALEEISNSMLSYPEWMGIEHDDRLTLGKNSSRCVLSWYWLSAQKENNAGLSLLKWIDEMDEAYDLLELDENERIRFFTYLPKNITNEIYLHLKNNDQQFGLDNTYSVWHRINHVYEGIHDSVKYLETCERYIDQNWRYGYPLVKDATEKEDFKSAETNLVRTFSSFLKRGFGHSNESENAEWYPESFLLTNRFHQIFESPETICELMEIWALVSEKRGNQERNGSACLQSAILRNSEDWDRIIDEYKSILKFGTFPALQRLFCEWKDIMAKRSMDLDGLKNKSDSWIHWLIDAEVDKNRNTKYFHQKLINWVNRLNKDENSFKSQWRMLARLTRDLPNNQALMKKYPTFVENVLPHEDSSDLSKARKDRLNKLDMEDHMATITQIWKNQLYKILPDPSTSRKSDYTHHAGWMRALYELNPGNYQQVLNQWQKQHPRRRNLWRDMKARQLPL